MEKVKLLISCLTDEQVDELFDRIIKVAYVRREHERYRDIIEFLFNEIQKRKISPFEEREILNKK